MNTIPFVSSPHFFSALFLLGSFSTVGTSRGGCDSPRGTNAAPRAGSTPGKQHRCAETWQGLICQSDADQRDSPAPASTCSHPDCSSWGRTASPPDPPGSFSVGGRGAEAARSITLHVACGLSWILCSQLFVEAALLFLTTLPTVTTVVASVPQATSLCPGDCPLALTGTLLHCWCISGPTGTLQSPSATN